MRLIPHYQKIVDFEELRVIGYEATIRGEDDFGGLFSAPYLFESAKKEGKVDELDIQARAISTHYGLPLLNQGQRLFLNIAPQTFQNQTEWFSIRNLPFEKITLEVTEQAPIHVTQRVLDRLGELRKQGMQLALDDFGVGFHTLKLVDKLSPEYLKLDRNVCVESSDKTLKSILRFCQESEITLIAEGVESEVQLNRLLQIGYKFFQGYYWGYPLRVEQMEQSVIG